MPDEQTRRIKVELLMPGDIILTASRGKVSKAIRLATKGQVSHAMICVQHGSIVDSTDDGVQAHNIQRELYGPDDHVMSGRRSAIKGLCEDIRQYRVRSCLRPVGVGIIHWP